MVKFKGYKVSDEDERYCPKCEKYWTAKDVEEGTIIRPRHCPQCGKSLEPDEGPECHGCPSEDTCSVSPGDPGCDPEEGYNEVS